MRPLEAEIGEAPQRWAKADSLRKDSAHYRPIFGNDVPDDLPYVWPVSDRDS